MNVSRSSGITSARRFPALFARIRRLRLRADRAMSRRRGAAIRAAVMRWRRPAITPATAPVGRTDRSSGQVWLPAIHLHLARHVVERMIGGLAACSTSARAVTMRIRQRVGRDRLILQRATHLSMIRHEIAATRTLLSGMSRGVPTATSPWPPRRLRAELAATRVASTAHGASVPSQRPTEAHVRSGAVAAGSDRRISTAPRRLFDGVGVRARRAGVGSVARPSLPGERAIGSLHTAPGRRAELLWRSPEPPAPRRSDEASPRTQSTSRSQAPGPDASSTPATVTRAAGRAARGGLLQLSDLAPSFVDRLADDVIRRVERRVRIERERRGL
ncbi:MAG: hypothetical protein M3Z10_06565 [Gemmatimonadota bacterium]|nr:hypothetical protein [Gemmatimonadota bacterium]